MAETILRTKLSHILLAVKDRLIDEEAVGEEQSLISLRMNPPVMALRADSYAIALPLNQVAEQASVDGGGRAGTLLAGRLNVYLRNRASLDEAYLAETWLTSPTAGILDKVNAVVDALQMWLPEDEDGDGLLAEPCRLVFWGEPKQQYHQPEWGDVVIEFEVKYLLDIAQTGD